MAALWRRVMRLDGVRVAAVLVALPVVAALAAYGVVATTSTPTVGALTAAVALLAVAGSGLVYAWRLGPGGLAD